MILWNRLIIVGTQRAHAKINKEVIYTRSIAVSHSSMPRFKVCHMDIINKLRLNHKSRIALVGSGGKTTLMYQLARDYQSRVILTTTTHMAQEQLTDADHHFTISSVNDIPKTDDNPAGRILLFTGPQTEADRVRGPDAESFSKLLDLAEDWDCPLIIEADGARQLPIKAPADHEPAIPEFVNTVIVTVGLSGLGKPLNADWVHRPELFSALADLPVGAEITSQSLGRMLCSPDGGLKNIPPDARKILLINQVDSFPNWRTFHEQLGSFLENYHAVVFTVLEDQMLLEVQERIAGIVLAAGGSARFGKPKQLLDWKGIPLVKHVVNIVLDSGLSPVVVVTGSDQDDVRQALKGTPVILVNNPEWENGQSTSVKAGIESLPEGVGAAIFVLVDQPFISPELIKKIRTSRALNLSKIIHPQVNDQIANPVLFDCSLFEELLSLEGDTGGRILFEEYPPRVFSWHDDRIQMDIDTPEDYQRMLSE